MCNNKLNIVQTKLHIVVYYYSLVSTLVQCGNRHTSELNVSKHSDHNQLIVAKPLNHLSGYLRRGAEPLDALRYTITVWKTDALKAEATSRLKSNT